MHPLRKKESQDAPGMLKMTALVFLLVVMTASCATDGRTARNPITRFNDASDCSKIKEIKVTRKEFIRPGTKYEDIKNQLIDQLKLDAVEQTLGVEIRRYAKTEIKMANGELSDDFKEINVEKARGYIKNYRIPQEDETVEQIGEMSVLSLTMNANVCIPRNYRPREVIAIADFTWEGYESQFDGLEEVIFSSFPDNGRFSMTREDPEETYHDWVISAKLISVNAVLDNHLGKALLNSLLKGLHVNGRSAQINHNVVRISATTYVQAENIAEQSVIASTKTLKTEIPSSSMGSREVIDSKTMHLIKDAVRETALDLFRKMNADR